MSERVRSSCFTSGTSLVDYQVVIHEGGNGGVVMTTNGSISVVIYDSYKFIKDTITNFIVTIFNVQSKYVITKHMHVSRDHICIVQYHNCAHKIQNEEKQ